MTIDGGVLWKTNRKKGLPRSAGGSFKSRINLISLDLMDQFFLFYKQTTSLWSFHVSTTYISPEGWYLATLLDSDSSLMLLGEEFSELLDSRVFSLSNMLDQLDPSFLL